jgi:wyosine [tRNA(Phe)-imidazoG37] synthetase (radical SAM superfamily)
MAFVFGPLPSRRLGQSLGVDPVPPKTCNWNCVYCQVGRTSPLQTERREFFPREEILAEVRAVVSAHAPGGIDWITFVGSGETTLYDGLGWLIRQVKQIAPIPVAVITNGSLLYRADVREELLPADAVLPTLDAGSARLYRKINRPSPSLSFELLVEGLQVFSRDYRGRLWIEVMLIKGLNDTEEALRDLAGVLGTLSPECVHLSVPSRPPCESWVELPDDAGVERAVSILGAIARVVQPAAGHYDLSAYSDITDAIVRIVSRHPMRDEELQRTLERWSRREVEDALQALVRSSRVQLVERHGERFWSGAECRYTEKCSGPGRLGDQE